MIKINIKLIVASFLCMLICLSLFSIAIGKNVEEEEKVISESDGVFEKVSAGKWTMTVHTQTGEVILKNNENNYSWYSNPPDKEDDTIAAGFNKMNLSAQIIISFVTPKNVLEKTNNFVGSIRSGTFEFEKVDSGVRFTYDFKREGFKIPVEYRIYDGVFRCKIITEDINEYGDNYLSEVQIMPFFGSGKADDEGYIMIPDGAGALINFGTSVEKAKTVNGYTGYVYGRDPVLTTVLRSTITESITVPMFGVKKNNSAFLAVIEQGDILSKITASPSNKETSYANVSPTMIYRSIDSAILREMHANEKSVLMFNKSSPKINNYCVAYHLLSESEADYSGMARRASSLYFENYETIKDSPQIYLEMTAGAQTNGYFLGVPVKKYVSMTNLKQADKIVSDMKSNGITNLSVKYDSWNKGGGYTKTPTKAQFQKDIIKDMSLSSFLENMGNYSVPIFFTSDLVRIYQSGNGVRKTSHSARALSGGLFTDYNYMLSTYRKDKNGLSWTYLKSTRFNENSLKLVNSMKKKGVQTYGDLSSGWNLTSDSNRPLFGEMTHITRQDSLEKYVLTYQKIKAETDLRLFDGGLGYTFQFATDITSLPNSSSRYDIFDEDIPFVQMMIHGYINYSAKPINFSSNFNLAVLKAVEYGSIPTYSLVYENEEKISETPYKERYSAKYSDWYDNILATTKSLQEVYNKTKGALMESHTKVADEVYKTTYSNGTLVFVNYGKENFLYKEKLILPESFMIFES